MKTKILLFKLLMVLSFANSFAAWDIYKSGLSVNGGYYDCQLDGLSPNFHNNYFGRFSSGGSLVINFAEMLTYKNGSSNACGGNLQYRVYRTCDTAPSFSTLALSFCCNQGGTDCSGGACGPDVNNPGDQKWRGAPGAAINVISGLTLSGTYIFEVYFDATGSTNNASGCEETKYSANGGINFRAYFEFGNNDAFTDGDFSTPSWSGDAANFIIANNSSTSGLLGSETTRTHTVKLNGSGGSTTGSEYISTQITTWDQQQEWYFWMGRDGLGAITSPLSASNQQMIYLFSSNANLEATTGINGYRMVMGEDGTSLIRLQRVDNGVATTIFSSANGVPAGLTDYGIAFKVTRNQLGRWTILSSTLPASQPATQSTATPLSCSELATVNHGQVTDNTYAPASNNFFGFRAVWDASVSAAARTAAEFDNFRFVALPPDTYVSLGSASGLIDENATLAQNAALTVSIFNPSAINNTTVDLVLTSGAAARCGRGTTAGTSFQSNYTTLTLTWAAGETGSKIVYLDPIDNALCDNSTTLNFALQNITGGTNAFLPASNITYALTIVDDDQGYLGIADQSFEAGNLSGWSITGNAAEWLASSTEPITGTYSLQHNTSATSGQSTISRRVDQCNDAGVIVGANTVWNFEISFPTDATLNSNFQVFLAATDSNFFSSNNNGYAVVIDQSSLPSAGANDLLRLYRVDNGVYASTPIINSSLDWPTAFNGGTRVGIEVVLSEAGEWTMRYDANGGFDALQTVGSGSEPNGVVSYPFAPYYGVRFKYLVSTANLLKIDNLNIDQSGCREVYTTSSAGELTNTANWSSVPLLYADGSGTAILGSQFDSFIIQANTQLNGKLIAKDISLSAGATINANASEIILSGNIENNGTFNAGTSTVVLNGCESVQYLGTPTTGGGFVVGCGSPTTTFYNLTINNPAGTVTVTDSTRVQNVLSMKNGTLNIPYDGCATFLSNNTLTSSIQRIFPTASISGPVTLQRYIPSIPSVSGYWFNLGCPIQNQTIQDWNDDIITSGFTGSDYPSYSLKNIMWYNEPTAGTAGVGYTFATNVTNSIPNDRGYFVWLNGVAQNIDNTGLIRQGSITQPLSYTVTSPGGIFDYGWNMVGNPYPSEVDWNLVSSALTGPRVYYVYDFQTKAYKFRNASTGSGTASRYIAHSQSFQVKVNSSGQNLVYQETYKTNTGAAFERSDDASASLVTFRLSKGVVADETMLVFDEQATADLEDRDAEDLEGIESDAVNMSLMSPSSIKLAQDARPYDQEISIPVFVKVPEAGDYIFTIVEAQNIPFGTCLYVEDLATGDVIQLNAGQEITAHFNDAFSGNRFVIHGSAPIEAITTPTSCNNSNDGSIDVTLPNGQWNLSLSGLNSNYEFTASGSVDFDHLAPGIYNLTITGPSSWCGNFATQLLVEAPDRAFSEIVTLDHPDCISHNDGAIKIEINNADWFTYSLYNFNEDLLQNGNREGHELILENLKAGVYYLQLESECMSERIPFTLQDEHQLGLNLNTPSITELHNGTFEIELDAQLNTAADVVWNIQSPTTRLDLEGEKVAFTTAEHGIYNIQANANGVCPESVSTAFELKSSVSNTAAADVIFMQSAYQMNALFKQSQSGYFTIIDAKGALIQTQSFSAVNRIEIPTHAMSAGVYNFTLNGLNAEPVNHRFIVEH